MAYQEEHSYYGKVLCRDYCINEYLLKHTTENEDDASSSVYYGLVRRKIYKCAFDFDDQFHLLLHSKLKNCFPNGGNFNDIIMVCHINLMNWLQVKQRLFKHTFNFMELMSRIIAKYNFNNFNRLSLANRDDDCYICLNRCDTVTFCKHYIHFTCYVRMMKTSQRCGMCRQDLYRQSETSRLTRTAVEQAVKSYLEQNNKPTNNFKCADKFYKMYHTLSSTL
jgi:hypothetical protein